MFTMFPLILLSAAAVAGPLRPEPILSKTERSVGLGYDVAALGDVDGDGFDDVAAAAGDLSGYTRVFRGGARGFASATLLLGGASSDGPTRVVQGVGDLDGDGLDDVYARWTDCPGGDGREACVFWGASAGPDGGEGAGERRLNLNDDDHLYPSGDVDGDGLLDVLKHGSPLKGVWPVPDFPATCPIFLGSGDTWGAGAFSDSNDIMCWSASVQGDVNGDGYGDLVAGDPGNWEGSSRVLVYFGGVAADSVYDERLESAFGEHYLGWSVAVADVDADGFDDVAAGQPSDLGGRVFLFGGGTSGLTEVWSATGPNAFGVSVALADLDADGDPDLAVGTPDASEQQSLSVYTNDAGFGEDAQTLDGPVGSRDFGNWVEDAGDINGDGAHELLVADPVAGSVFVYAGDGPDADGDGVGDPVDCAPTDAGVRPGLAEHCDGIDEDCDGDIDDEATDAPTWYADADGDGYGASSGDGERSCAAPVGHVADASDCDDDDDAVYTGAPEVKGDGVDQDCDGADLAEGDTASEEVPAPAGGCATAGGAGSGFGGWALAALASSVLRRRRSANAAPPGHHEGATAAARGSTAPRAAPTAGSGARPALPDGAEVEALAAAMRVAGAA